MKTDLIGLPFSCFSHDHYKNVNRKSLTYNDIYSTYKIRKKLTGSTSPLRRICNPAEDYKIKKPQQQC
jgi:hypothetical protein